MIECCEEAELTLSQEKRQSDNNGRSNTCYNNVTKGVNVDGWLSSEEKETELEMIECCDQAELTLSQEKRRSDNTDISNACYNNVTKGVNVDGWFSSEEKEFELEMIECCEEAELTLSQEKRRNDNNNRSNTGTCYNNVTKANVDGWFSSEEKESELEMIECCEQAELTLSQEKRRSDNNGGSNTFNNNVTKGVNVDGWFSSEEKEFELEIIECCEQAELTLSQEKRRSDTNRSNTGTCYNNVTKANVDGWSSSEEKESELEMIECCEEAELTLSQEKRRSDKNNRSNTGTCYNNVTKANVDGWSSSEEKESELEMIECCEQAELTLSQEKRQSDNNGRSNTCYNNVAKGVDGWFSGEEKESKLEIIECCEKVELTSSQEKRRHKLGRKAENNEKDCLNNMNKVKKPSVETVRRASETRNINGKLQIKVMNEFEIDTNDLDQEKEKVCKQVELSECQVLSDKVPVCKKTGNSDCSLNMFGLFGITSSDEDEMDSCFDREMECYNRRSYFNEVPDEMLENIFCQLPLVDLLLSLSLVCMRWYRIISNKKFLEWKKRYNRYKYSFDSRKEINDLLAEAQLHIPSIFPSQLCR